MTKPARQAARLLSAAQTLPRTPACARTFASLPRRSSKSPRTINARRWQSTSSAASTKPDPPEPSQPVASTSASATSSGPVALYEQRVKEGILRSDDYQRTVAQLLQRLHDELLAYEPPDIPEPVERPGGFLGRLISSSPTIPPIPDDVPKGVYLFGDVGCGKTMLMDLFYDSLPASLGRSKRRIHFHAFMMDVHQRAHKLNQEGFRGSDSVVPIARQLARSGRVLCFDEFQVTDIVDAMILKRLLESLLAYGVVCIMTSNRKPDDLYKNGIQRKSFLPCIDLIKSRFVVEDLDSGLDYRKVPRALSRVYFDPPSDTHQLEFQKLFMALTDADGGLQDGRTVKVWGRSLSIPLASKNVARFSFPELCGHPLSAADYLGITKEFETIFIDDVPKLTFHQRDWARRFILFIDACYESRTKLFTLSEVPITQIFSDKAGNSSEISAHMRSTMDDLGLSATEVGASSIFSGEEEVFAFARAVSRLTEMGTKQWANSSKGPS